MLGRYLVGPTLGAGGMATVSFGLARGALGFSRPIAIKRIHPGTAAESRFRQAIPDEARIAARVRHADAREPRAVRGPRSSRRHHHA
jgi:serine/threonine protein kinase